MVALFVALGGVGAYAADTVFSTDIVDGEVKQQDIAQGAVTGSKIRQNAIQTAHVIDNSLSGNDINESTLAAVPVADNGARRFAVNYAVTQGGITDVGGGIGIYAACGTANPPQGTGTAAYMGISVPTDGDINYSFITTENEGLGSAHAFGAAVGPGVPSVFFGRDTNPPPPDNRGLNAPTGGVKRAEGQVIYRNSERVVSITFHAMAFDSVRRCEFTGTAVNATT